MDPVTFRAEVLDLLTKLSRQLDAILEVLEAPRGPIEVVPPRDPNNGAAGW